MCRTEEEVDLSVELREGESSQSSQGRKKGKNKDQFDQAGSMTPLMQMITFSKI